MKQILLVCTTLLLLLISLEVLAAYDVKRVTITTNPVTLTKTTTTTVSHHGDVWVAPENVGETAPGYYYFNINNQNQVCYATLPPELANEVVTPVTVQIGGVMTQLSCITPSSNYFIIQSP